MIVLDERNQVKLAVQDWLAMYGKDRTYRADTRRRRVGEELLELDQETATAADIAEIIGNSMWVREATCDECGKQTWDIVEIGEPRDYESATAHICRDCLSEALRLLGAA